MAWDDAQSREFVGGLANAFYQGYDPTGYTRTRLADEEMALRRAQDAREQAAHAARMRETDRAYGLTDDIIKRSAAADQPIPEGQMGADGYGPPTPAGLRTAPMDAKWLEGAQLRLAAAKGDNATITGLRQEGERKALDSGLAKHMADWRKMTLEEKINLPWVQEQFNRNPNVPGELAITKQNKLVLTNYDGKGSTKRIDPDLLDRAAAAYFLEQNGKGEAAVNAMGAVGKERYDRTRQRTIDNNALMVQLQNAGNQDAQLDISRANLGLAKNRADQERYQVLAPTQGYEVDGDGKMVPVIRGLRVGQKAGTYEAVSVPMPGGNGFIPGNAFDPAKMQKVAEGMIGQPTGRTDGKTGKPELYTPETAMEAVRQDIVRNYTGGGRGAPAIPADAAEKARAALRKQGQGAPAPVAATDQQRTVDPAARASQLREMLARDDRIKAGGFSGVGLRAMQEGSVPLGMAARREMERELASLTGN